MWKDYSRSYIKNNRASNVSIMAAVLAATMFLSLLCSIAYNFWVYDVEQIILEEGGWQGRIVCESSDPDALSEDNLLSLVYQFANVEKAVINEELSKKKEKWRMFILKMSERFIVICHSLRHSLG